MAGEGAAGSADRAMLEDAFDIASCSKSVTATMAALLVEEKKARWDIRLDEAFPELKAAMHPSYAAVTLEPLLRHRSGLGCIMDRNDRWAGCPRSHAGEVNFIIKNRFGWSKPRVDAFCCRHCRTCARGSA